MQRNDNDGTLPMPEDTMTLFLDKAREIIVLKEQISSLTGLEGPLKKTLMALLEQWGEPYGPEGQHQAIVLDPPIRNVERLVRQIRVSTVVDEQAAEAVARSRDIYERLFKPVMVLDQDAVTVAYLEGKITDEDMKKIFPKKVVPSFVLERKK